MYMYTVRVFFYIEICKFDMPQVQPQNKVLLENSGSNVTYMIPYPRCQVEIFQMRLHVSKLILPNGSIIFGPLGKIENNHPYKQSAIN